MGAVQSGDFDFKQIDYESLGDVSDKPNITLTNEDIQSVQQTWSLAQDKTELGMNVMIRIFQAHADIKHVWIFATKLETEAEMRSCSQLRYHAKKLTDTLTKIVDSVEPDLDNFKDMLIKLGTKHYHYGLKCSYFMFFQESVQYALQQVIDDKKLFDKKAKDSWNKFFILIIGYMCVGIKMEEKKYKLSGIEN